MLALHLADVVNAADVRVGDLPRDAHLGIETLEARGVIREGARGRNFSATGWPSFRSSAR